MIAITYSVLVFLSIGVRSFISRGRVIRRVGGGGGGGIKARKLSVHSCIFLHEKLIRLIHKKKTKRRLALLGP